MTMIFSSKADGEHFTLAGALNTTVLATASWRSGAIMAACREITVHEIDGKVVIRLDCPEEGYEAYYQQLIKELAETGPVNVGLTQRNGCLRFTVYFPDERTLKRRMDAAIASMPN